MAVSRAGPRSEGTPQHSGDLQAGYWPPQTAVSTREPARVGREHLGALFALIEWGGAGERGRAAARLAANTLVQRYFEGSADARANLQHALGEARTAAERLLGDGALALRMLAIVIVGSRAFVDGNKECRTVLVRRGQGLAVTDQRAQLELGDTLLATIGQLASGPLSKAGENPAAMVRRLGEGSGQATLLAVRYGQAAAPGVSTDGPAEARPRWLIPFVTLMLLVLVSAGLVIAALPSRTGADPQNTTPTAMATGSSSPLEASGQVSSAPSPLLTSTPLTPSPMPIATATPPLPPPAPTSTRGAAPASPTPVAVAPAPAAAATPTETAAATPAETATATPAETATATPAETATATPAETASPTASATLESATEPPSPTPTPIWPEIRTSEGASAGIVGRGQTIYFEAAGFEGNELFTTWLTTPAGDQFEHQTHRARPDGTASWSWTIPSHFVPGTWLMVAGNERLNSAGRNAFITVEVVP